MSLELYSQAFTMQSLFNDYYQAFTMHTLFNEHSYYPIYLVGLIVFSYILVNARCNADSDIDESISALAEKQADLEQRLAEAQAKFLNAEKLVAEARSFAAQETTQAHQEETSFACVTASTMYVEQNPHLNRIPKDIEKYLSESPGTTRQILARFADDKFASPTRHQVNSCLYYLLHQGRVKKSEDMPPVWSK
jgi:hypothetical protein